ncbi:MAG: gamma-glutamyl-gamma-aminobutyrate hydrolase family protein [Acidobacteriota bacterium]
MTTILVSVIDNDAAPYFAALAELGFGGDQTRQATAEHLNPGQGVGDIDLDAMLDGVCGLVLAGGGDIDPVRYGESPLRGVELEYERERDALEWRLLAAARVRRLPVWGICRGMQMLNVYLGGTLWQDLPRQVPASAHHQITQPDYLAHQLRVAPRGALAPFLHDRLGVNSRHHQGIKDLAPDLYPTAWSEDGLVEATTPRSPDGWWREAVQWHPENLLAHSEHRGMWRAFLDAVTRWERTAA